MSGLDSLADLPPWAPWAALAVVAVVVMSQRGGGVTVGTVTTIPADPTIAAMEQSRHQAVGSLASSFFGLFAERGGQAAAVDISHVNAARDKALADVQLGMTRAVAGAQSEIARYDHDARRAESKNSLWGGIIGGGFNLIGKLFG